MAIPVGLVQSKDFIRKVLVGKVGTDFWLVIRRLFVRASTKCAGILGWIDNCLVKTFFSVTLLLFSWLFILSALMESSRILLLSRDFLLIILSRKLGIEIIVVFFPAQILFFFVKIQATQDLISDEHSKALQWLLNQNPQDHHQQQQQHMLTRGCVNSVASTPPLIGNQPYFLPSVNAYQ